ncbi:uncharacterized protein C6orf163 homolog [Acanthaster planci]|uniref:Uncharacterized protein C6orf163 homolog n=1 Tax=Acanthaster planci TaxID=133434 RepID=A0A8B7YH31_ACAPL|nr:uncharacterized protein C6orf163 homolog [Acanthaster planci]XP_022091892.1 uncharacterized protein C6orf163 homolog [Acanthaster planci]
MDKHSKEQKALSPRYDGIPLRYEESKPVQTQIYTHQNILDIGQNIHVQWEVQVENEKERAVSAAQHKVWQEAEHMKNVALEKSRELAKEEMEKAVTDLKRSHEKSLKEEALRVEGIMSKQATEQVRQEKETGEKILRETVEKVRAQGLKEKEEAVSQARKEEVEIARKEAERVARVTADREAKTAKVNAQEKAEALATLEEKMKRERMNAVQTAQMEERHVAAVELGRVKSAHQLEIEKLQETIQKLELRNEETLTVVEQECQEKKQWEAKYHNLKDSFQLFINKTKGFDPGQADFLLK